MAVWRDVPYRGRAPAAWRGLSLYSAVQNCRICRGRHHLLPASRKPARHSLDRIEFGRWATAGQHSVDSAVKKMGAACGAEGRLGLAGMCRRSIVRGADGSILGAGAGTWFPGVSRCKRAGCPVRTIEEWCGRGELNPQVVAHGGFSYLCGFRRPRWKRQGRSVEVRGLDYPFTVPRTWFAG